MSSEKQQNSTTQPATTILELEQSKLAVLNTLSSQHSRRSYEHAIESSPALYANSPKFRGGAVNKKREKVRGEVFGSPKIRRRSPSRRVLPSFLNSWR